MDKWFQKFTTLNLFKASEITLNDKELYEKYIKLCDYPANLWSGNFSYLWAHNFSNNLKIYKTIIDDMLVTIILTKNGRLFLPCLPFGKGSASDLLKVLIKCGNVCEEWNQESKYTHKALVNPLNQPQVDFLSQNNLFTKFFTKEKLSGLERHYSITKVKDLKGKEFSKLRAKINKFHRTYPNAITRDYKLEDFKKIINLNKIWVTSSGQKYQKIFDGFYFEPLIKYQALLDHKIIIIELNKKIIGMNTAEILPTGASWGCITKFDKAYPGISEVLTVEMAKKINLLNPNVTTINVGSDLGSTGLAFNKERFRPVYNFERFALFYQNKKRL